MVTLALDMGGTRLKSALVEEDGRVRDYAETDSHAAEGAERFIAVALQECERYKDYHKIGISVTGQVNVATGAIAFANENVPHFTGVQLRQIFEGRFHKPTVVENDVNAAALGELIYGAAQGFKNVLCVTYGTGIGGALLLGGSLYRGTSGGAGEIGHMVTHRGGKPCACGQRGCYEQYGSVNALLSLARENGYPLSSGRALFDAAQKDPALAGLIRRWADEIACGLASGIHLLQPELVVLGGGVMERAALVDTIRRQVQTYTGPNYSRVKVCAAQLGNKAGLLGAAYLAQKDKERAA